MGSVDSPTGFNLEVLPPAAPARPVEGRMGSPDSESGSQGKASRHRSARQIPVEEPDEPVVIPWDILDINLDIDPISHQLDRLG
jgi:hypothetical protein